MKNYTGKETGTRMALNVVQTLCDLVRIPSVNPMGRAVAGPEYLEEGVTNHLEGLFRQMGLPWERFEVTPKRANIIVRLEGDLPVDEPGGFLMFEAHQDTVPVDGMTIPPWDPQVRNGRVYGRGSCDIKGGMACMLAALSRLADERPRGRPTLVVACSVNEEWGLVGATHLAHTWQSGRSKLIPRTPDAIIVAEPTLLNVVVAHKGVARWRCRTLGRAAHSSRPDCGDNAIYRMTHVLQALEDYANTVVPGLGSHRLVGSPTLSVGLIAGGLSVNTVPDHCVIEIDRRVLPEEDPMTVRQHVIDYLANRLPAGFPIQHEEPFGLTRGLPDRTNGLLAGQLQKVIRQCGGPGALIGVPYGTNAPAYSVTHAPTVVFGPGSIEQAHTADEWVAIDQLEQAAEILYRFGSQPVAVG